MVRFGQTSPDTAGSAPAPGAGIGTTTLRELSVDPGRRRPVLLDHHVLILVTVGHGTYEVDFRTYQCRPGTLILVRPGQLIRADGPTGLDAVVICWTGDVLARIASDGTTGHPFGTTHWQLAGEDQDAVINEVSQLVVDCQRHGGGPLAAELLRHQLAVLLLRLALLPDQEAGVDAPTANAETTGTYRRLRREIEEHYRTSRRVEDYAARLGCSVRTLTRACLAATGRSAKQLVDDRVALQARRLLAATEEPIADVGRTLGFPEPTNFGRFFQREVGQSPGTFRAGLDRGSPTGGSSLDGPSHGSPLGGGPTDGGPIGGSSIGERQRAAGTGGGIGPGAGGGGGPGDGIGAGQPGQQRVPGQRPVTSGPLVGTPPHASVRT
ncbi:AraC family transcriptional regulator [Micromonospora sp. NBC_01796]|uniref:AraC family transcriptional regulator n=1 Tax=Micromonospora sp. NBC_01796 TaxID=2975987 RepID=UPI002DDA7C13|nr:AraC family transcriptional regulator [Micromonospora sp. NBC_01796]WSA86530.1 AraC family transcriptional regulator [Micromonospora sp. NBC_01796]